MRFADLTRKEHERGYRVIGGDKGDLRFGGYFVTETETVLNDPQLFSNLDLTQDEVDEIAEQVLWESFESVGIETVYNS